MAVDEHFPADVAAPPATRSRWRRAATTVGVVVTVVVCVAATVAGYLALRPQRHAAPGGSAGWVTPSPPAAPTFPDKGRVRPKPSRYGDVDCSGFLRLVYGCRMGYPLRDENTAGAGLPRRAFAMSQFGPGVVVVPNHGAPATDYTALQPGDLLFFNSDPGTGPFRTDHSGIYLGRDADGHYRFISSRSKANGPTFGDTGGAAVLDGGGHWSQRWRIARRL